MVKVECKKLFIGLTCLFLFSLFQFTGVYAEENTNEQVEAEQLVENEELDVKEEKELTEIDEEPNEELTDDSVISEDEPIEEEISSPIVHFESEVLLKLVAKELGIENRPITEADMEMLTDLTGSQGDGSPIDSGEPIDSLVGLEYAVNLSSLSLVNRQISDISSIEGLTELKFIDFSDNLIKDITPLSKLTKLDTIVLENNLISDITPLANLTELYYIIFDNNQIKDISVVENFKKIFHVYFENNLIEDITPITKLDSAWTIVLNNNRINDITPLRNMDVNGKRIHMANNPFQDDETIGFLMKNFIEQLTFNVNDVPHLYIWGDGVCAYDPNTWQCVNDDVFQWEEWLEYFDIFDAFSEEDGNITFDYTRFNEPLMLNADQINYLKKHNANIVISADDVTLSIPASAFKQSGDGAVIEIEKLEKAKNSLSDTYDFTITQGSQIISTFTDEIQLTFEVDSKKVNDEKKLKVFYFNEKTNQWESIGGQYKDGKVTATTNHFSMFTVFEQEIDESVEESDDDKNISKEDIDTSKGNDKSNEMEDPVNQDNKQDKNENNTTGSTDDNKEVDHQTEGKELPNTASNAYNLLLIGAIFILFGGILTVIYRRRMRV